MRVALYARVSTQEQAKYGLSIDTQLDNLTAWARNNGHSIVGTYIDRGISGKKPPHKRPELSRFFADVENGVKVDLLVFTKLDRFFRSVKLYYQAVDVLERYRIAWQAIQEDYETLTASGRMKVNIMLSVAENEADRTGERIKVVFERKIANGEPIGGKAMLPIGYKTENKEIVADEYADAVKAGFDYYEKTGSIHATMDYLHSEHNLQVIMATVKKMLHNKSYTGMYRGNPSFFPQIVTIEQFQRVQEMLNARSVRKNKANRVYLFPGIITCACCGHRLAGMYSTSGYYYYRCNHAQIDHLCNNRKMVSELQLEQWLLVNVEDAFDGMATAELSPKQGKKKVNNAEINKKLERLKDLYVDGLITKPQYIADYEKLQAALNENTAPARRDYAGLRNLVGEALRPSYAKLTRDNKRILWRSIIDHITVDADGNKQIFFAV